MSTIALRVENRSSSAVGISPDAQRIVSVWLEARHHFNEPISTTTVAQRFADLAATWKGETEFMSSIQQAVMLPAYQEIIGLGYNVVPLILNELQREPGHWFWALAAITGENPVKPESRGSMRPMADDWLAWGESRGLVG